jgi:hypothetical protein
MVIILAIKKVVKADRIYVNGEGRIGLEDRADHEKFKQNKREGESL